MFSDILVLRMENMQLNQFLSEDLICKHDISGIKAYVIIQTPIVVCCSQVTSKTYIIKFPTTYVKFAVFQLSTNLFLNSLKPTA